MMLLFVLFATLLNISSSQLIANAKCTADEAREFDRYATIPFVINSGAKFPETVAQVTRYCSAARNADVKMKIYAKKCLEQLPRQVR